MSVLALVKAFLANDNDKEVAIYKIQDFGKVMLVTCAVVVNAAVFAIVGVPRASGDPPIDAGGGPPGGAGPPGGIADAPEGASNADGLWSATVGGIEHAGLGTSDVGRLLWRGNKVSRSILGDDGIPRTVQVCQGFPEIVLETSETGTAPGGGEATVTLDLTNCTVALSELTRTKSGAQDSSDSQSAGPQAMDWNRVPTDGFVPIAWRGDMEFQTASLPSAPNPHRIWRDSTLTMRLRDQFGLRLTKTEIQRKYWADTRVTRDFRYDCDTGSPAAVGGVTWHEDACSGGHGRILDRARAWAQGRFHGESGLPSRARFNRSTHHNLNVLLNGSATRDVARCTVNPTSIEDLTVTVRRFGITVTGGVKITCDYLSITGAR